jgi:hypothetical protein
MPETVAMILCGLELLKSTGQIQQTSHNETTSQTVTVALAVAWESDSRSRRIAVNRIEMIWNRMGMTGVWPVVSLPEIPAMATLQIRRKSETYQINLCDKPLTISTRHGISSIHGSVTIQKVAHTDRQSRSQHDTNRKGERLYIFLFSFFSFFLILVSSARLVEGLCATFSSGTTYERIGNNVLG